jgi:hypothetical protein
MKTLLSFEIATVMFDVVAKILHFLNLAFADEEAWKNVWHFDRFTSVEKNRNLEKRFLLFCLSSIMTCNIQIFVPLLQA